MAGTPDPVLGSEWLTLLVAALAGAAVAGGVLLRVGGGRQQPQLRRLLAGGLAYAVGCLALWAAVRAVAEPATFGAYSPGGFFGFLALATVVLGLQFALPVYLYARWRLLAPMVGLFAATALAVYLFLRVGGETDVLWLYAVLFGPAAVGSIAVAALLEGGVRRVGRTWTA